MAHGSWTFRKELAPKVSKDLVNQSWNSYVALEVLNLVGDNPVTSKAKGGQVIKKKKGSMIDEPVKQQTTAEVLQELKGLRK